MDGFEGLTYGDYQGIVESDPDPFPGDQANQLVDTGNTLDWMKLGIAFWGIVPTGAGSVGLVFTDSFEDGVRQVCDKVLELVGNWSVARHLATEWVRLAQVPGQIKEELEDSYGVMVKYWEGGAFKSFTEYHDAVVEKLDATTEKMADIAEKVTSLIGVVFKTFADAVGFLISCVAKIVNAWEPWAWVDAISALLEDFGALVSASIDTMGSYVEKAVDIATSDKLFPVLPEREGTREAFSPPDEWGVSQAPGNG